MLPKQTPREHGDQDNGPPILFDFAVNLNPNGPAPEVAAAARAASIEDYPDSTSRQLRQAFAVHLGCSPNELVFAGGSAALLWTTAAVLHKHRQPALIVGPTFSEYAAAVEATGAPTIEMPSVLANGFQPNLAAIAARGHAENAVSVYLCNPNNPTGVLLSHAAVRDFANALGSITLVVDEAFLSLSSSSQTENTAPHGNMLRVRSLTKEHCLAGLRLGYAWGAPDLVAAIETTRAPWATSSAAQAAGLELPNQAKSVEDQRKFIEQDRIETEQALASLGFEVFPGSANFSLVRHPNAAAIHGELRAAGIRLRDCTSFGLPGFLRIAARPHRERAALIQALQNCQALATNATP